MSRRRSILGFLCVLAGTFASAQGPEAAMQKYCSGCHNARVKSGGLSLDGFTLAGAGTSIHTGEKVLKRLRARFMPPAGLPRPDEATYESMVGALESSLDRASAAKADPGRPDTFRRLNRFEYRNAVRDLLDLDVDVAALLPADDSSHGFDNITVGNLSPTLLERYLSAARKISRLAMGLPGRAPGGETIVLPPDLTQEEHFEKLPLGTRGGLSVAYTFPADAEYEFQLRLARDRNEHVEGIGGGPHEVELMLDGTRVRLFSVKGPAQGDDHSQVDRDLNVRLQVKAGPHTIAVAFPKTPSALLETERQPYQAHFNMDRHPRVRPAVYSITVNGPYALQGPGDSPSRRRILACKPAGSTDEESCATNIVRTLARRAFRRPVNDDDVTAPMRFYREARASEPGPLGFDTGIEMALRAVLVSPEFLFRVEQDPTGVKPGTAYRVSPLELASRLSFFLWSSIPDDELLAAAERGDLQRPAELEKQVRRMLNHSRSQALVNSFAEQWLYLRNLSSAQPDMRIFAGFDDNLRQAFRRETELFFEHILRGDRSVLELIGADYTFLNERLAKHYGIPNVYGSRFRRVDLGADRTRGGLLRHGSVLTVTSYATRTSPVIRGKWILDNVLGVPPPPPPGNVPALKDNAAGMMDLPVRERLKEHRANPACSGCHALMDPVGFSFENYDGVGRWRTTEGSHPVDASAGMADGSKFNGVEGLEQAILKRPELFATTFTEKLLTYGLGRGLDSADGPAVREIVRKSKPADFRFSSFVLGIVNSTPFQMRRAQP